MRQGLRELLEGAVPLLAEDLRLAREELGISSKVAAKRAGLEPAVYRVLEEGEAERNVDNAVLMVLAARGLGLNELRFAYVDEQLKHIKVDYSVDGRATVFVDTLRMDARELKKESVFVSPSRLFALTRHIGFSRTLSSRRAVDKQLIELWVAAIFTLYLDRGWDYYVRLGRDDPPDAEILKINRADGSLSGIRLEIAQHGSHSRSLAGVIKNKLRKKYHEGTILLVFVEEAESFAVSDIEHVVHANNPHNYRVFIVGGSKTPDRFVVLPGDEIRMQTDTEAWWVETFVDVKNASKGHRGYEGVVLKPPGSQFLPAHPMFLKEMELQHQM